MKMLINIIYSIVAAIAFAAQSGAATIITFDAPDAGTGSGQGTLSRKINEAGLIAGQYIDASGVIHSYLRTADGAITEFDPPGAAISESLSINSAGTVGGLYRDGNLWFMASCALWTVPLRSSTLRVEAHSTSKAPWQPTSTTLG